MIKIWQEKKQDEDVHLALVDWDCDIRLVVINPETGTKFDGGNLLNIAKFSHSIHKFGCVHFPNNPFKLDADGAIVIE